MAKLLEKALTGAIKERKHTLGTKQVISSMKNSKLVVISQSVSTKIAKKIEESAQNDSVPLLHFNDTCLLYTSPSPRDATLSRMQSSA